MSRTERTDRAAERRRSHGAGTIESRGRGRWLVRVSYGRDSLTGRRVGEAVTVTGSKRDAEKVIHRLLVGQEAGHGPKQARARLTVGACMDTFTKSNPSASEVTRRRMQQSWRLYASDRLRATPLRDLSPARLSDELAPLREQVSPRTGKPLGGRTVGIFFAISGPASRTPWSKASSAPTRRRRSASPRTKRSARRRPISRSRRWAASSPRPRR